MRRIASLIAVAFVLTFGAPHSKAQEQPKAKSPRLSMENFEGGKMILPPGKNSRETETKSADATSGGFASVNARTVLENTFAQLEKVKSLRMRMKMSNEQNEERETVIETVRPNRVRIRSTGMEMITVGSTIYFKTNDGPWQKQTSESGRAESLNPKDLIKMALDSPGISISGWALGEEVLAGTPTKVYEISIEEQGKNKQASLSVIRMWIGKSDELPRKMEFLSPGSALKMSVSYGDFNANIVINPPRM